MTDENLTTTEILENEPEALETEQPEPGRRETMDESVQAVLAELEGSGEAETDENVQGDKGPEADKPIRSASEAASILAKSKGKKRQVVEAKDLEPTGRQKQAAPAEEKIDAPAMWKAEDKEAFEKLDVVSKRNALKFFKDAQAGVSKVVQEVQQQRQKYSDLDRITQHYAPEWAKRGVTDIQAIAQMCAQWHETVKNPVKAVADLMQQAKVSPQALAEYLSGEPQQQGYQPQKDFTVTPDEIRRIVAEESQKSYQTQAQYNATRQAQMEVDSVRQLRSQAGSFLYPELHGEQPKGLDTLVQFEKDADPSISWAEATKRGIHVYRARSGYLQGPASLAPRLTPQQEIEKIRSGSVSVKGRGNSAIPSVGAAKKGESVKDSATIVYQQLFGNNSN